MNKQHKPYDGRALRQYLKALPKAELHMHLDGSLEAELMFAMAKRNGVHLPYKSIEETRAAYQFNNLNDFLRLYFIGAEVMRNEQDFYDLTYTYLERAHQDGVCHSEMFVSPQTHLGKKGITVDTLLNGTIKAMQEAKINLGISSSIIINFNRSYVKDTTLIGKPNWPEQAKIDAPIDAQTTYQLIQTYLLNHPDKKPYIVGFGLDCTELGFPPIWFEKLFKQIKKEGYKTVAHAGEEGPADYVKQARVNLLVDRIDHGNKAIDDDEIMNDIIEHQIPLTMCPLSNQSLCVVTDLTTHPLKKMLAKQVKVTINSDDPAYFGGYILDNYMAITEALHLTIDELRQLVKNSIEASFLENKEKDILINKINNCPLPPPFLDHD